MEVMTATTGKPISRYTASEASSIARKNAMLSEPMRKHSGGSSPSVSALARDVMRQQTSLRYLQGQIDTHQHDTHMVSAWKEVMEQRRGYLAILQREMAARTLEDLGSAIVTATRPPSPTTPSVVCGHPFLSYFL